MPIPVLFQRFARDVRGGVSVIAALSLTSVVGMAALGVEATQGYAAKAQNQRVADAAALAAAMAYGAKLRVEPNATYQAVLDPAAKAVAAANGIAETAVTTEALGLNQTSGTSKVTTVRVTVRTPVQLRLARLISNAASYNVASSATATVTQPATTPTNTVLPGCLYAISTTAQRGIWVSGAAQINAPNCNVMSNRLMQVEGSAQVTAGEIAVNGNIDAAWSTNVRAGQITASGTFIDPRGAQNRNDPSIRATPDASKKYSGRSVSVTDPLSANTLLSAALDKTGVSASFPQPTSVANPSTPGAATDWTFNDSGATGPTGNKAKLVNDVWQIDAGNYNIGKLTVTGTRRVEFKAPSAVTIRNGIDVNGTTRLTVLGSGNDWKVNGGVSIIGSGNGANLNSAGVWGAEFGNGTYHFAGGANFGKNTSFGQGAVTINGDTKVGGSVTFRMGVGPHHFGGVFEVGGSSTASIGEGKLTILNLLAVNGSTTVTFGAGDVAIGSRGTAYTTQNWENVPAGNSIWLSGTTTVTFSGTSLGNTFSTAGAVTQGCCNPLTFPAAANHFIGGTMTLNGPVFLAPSSGSGTAVAGAYTVRGNFIKSATEWLRGSGVSVFMSGYLDTAGASQAYLTAPTGTSTPAGDALVNILFASRTTAATTWNGSTQSTYTGMVYLPRANVTVSGAGSVTGCFGIVAQTITVNGSGAAGTQCSNVGASATSSGSGGTSGTPVVRLIR